MCRNIKTLYNFAPPASPGEIRAAALQYVRKVTGITRPSKANEAVFEEAVEEVTLITARLLTEQLTTTASPKDRQIEQQRARERGQKRDERVRRRVLEELRSGAS